MNSNSKRRSRYKRDSNSTGRYQHPGDTEIIELIHEYKYLTRSLLEQLTGRKDRSIKRRLRFLFDHEYLAKIQYSRFFSETGSTPDIYVLDRKGRTALKEFLNLEPDYHRTQLANKNNDPQLEHTLLTNFIRVLFTTACSRTESIKLFNWHRESRELRDVVRLQNGIKWPIAPDAFFTLKVDNLHQSFFLESDCSTMDYSRMRKKLLAYYTYYKIIREGIIRQKRQKKGLIRLENKFKVPSFRVLIVVSNRVQGIAGERRRIANLIKTVTSISDKGRGWGGFWFTPAGSLNLETPLDVLEKPVWQIGYVDDIKYSTGETHPLLG